MSCKARWPIGRDPPWTSRFLVAQTRWPSRRPANRTWILWLNAVSTHIYRRCSLSVYLHACVSQWLLCRGRMNSLLASLCTWTCSCWPRGLESISCNLGALRTSAALYQMVYHECVSFWRRCATLSLFGQYTNCQRSDSHVGTGWHSWVCCLWTDLSRVHSTGCQWQYSETQPSLVH